MHGLPAWTYYEFKEGTYLCREGLAKRYKNIAAVRDSTGSANCPAGTTPCSAAAVTECVSPDKHATDCPITDVKLVEASSYDPS